MAEEGLKHTMFVCRLFDRDQPFQQVDARLLAEGTMSIGRDPAADWPIVDRAGMISRIHCTLSVEDGQLLLRDRSTNGTYLANGERAPHDAPVQIDVRDVLQLGGMTILIDQPSTEQEPEGDLLATTFGLPLAIDPPRLPTDWTDGPAAPPPHRDQSLLDAFCEGARIDVSALSGEEPAELMVRLGAMYQQTVLGLSTLLAERTRLKSEYELDRTAIGAMDNNPFKWMPSRRLAQDLLCTRQDGFLSDAAAVRASFEDIGRHLAASAAGANAAISATLAALEPSEIEREAAGVGFSLKSRSTQCWAILARRHAELAKSEGRGAATIADAFRAGYAGASQLPADQ